MCTGAEIVGLALSGGGLLLNQSASDDAAAQQQKIINNAQEETSRLNTKKADTINKFAADTFNPVNRNQRYEDAATKSESSLVDALLSANGGESGEIKQGAEGNLSSDYVRGKASSTASATEDILKRARLMGRNNAAGNLYEKEGLAGGQLASDVLGINSATQRVGSATRAGLSGVQNDGSLAAGLLMAAGGSAGSLLNKKPSTSSQSNWGVTI